jgi:hypothetical protein
MKSFILETKNAQNEGDQFKNCDVNQIKTRNASKPDVKN